MTINGPVALVTGAGSGIGRALAIELSRSGYFVLLIGRNRKTLEGTAALAVRGLTKCVEADVTTPTGRSALIRAVAQKSGQLDVLVNNAGVVRVALLEDMSEDDVRSIFETNVIAPTLICRDLLPFLKAGRSPRIVNVGSMFGDVAFPYFAAYSSSKFALRGLSDALRRELMPAGISVTYVAPRATDTGAASAFEHLIAPFGMQLDTPETVARSIIHGMMSNRRTIYPRLTERAILLLQHLLPRAVDRNIVDQYKKMLGAAAISTDN